MVQARQTSDDALIFDETLTMSTDSFVIWDPAGVPTTFGTGTMDDFLLRTVPNQGPFNTLQDYGPYNMITVNQGDILPLAGSYSTLVSFPSGPDTFSITAGAIDIDALYSASHSSGFPPPAGPTPADITGVSNMTGTVIFGAGTIQVELTGVVIGTIDGTPFGEAGNDLDLTANITFFGNSTVVPTPEPSTALMMALGLIGMTVAGSRRRNR